MSGDKEFKLADAAQLFEQANNFADAMIAQLQDLLGFHAAISHVGATSIPGCLTKGDVDLVIRVEPKAFPAARSAMDERYVKNLGSPRDRNFASYTDDSGPFPLGVQLVVRGSEYDTFHRFADNLRRSQPLLESYNALKRSHEGADMEAYRKAKANFIERTLARAHG